MSVAVFGPIVTGDQVADQVASAMEYWMPSYLAELERRTSRDPGALPVPKSWSSVGPDLDKRSDSMGWPAGIVMSFGTIGQPLIDGAGRVNAWFEVRVAVLVQARQRADAERLAHLYAGAVFLIALQHPRPGVPDAEGQLSGRMEWVGFQNAAIARGATDNGWATEVALEVLVEGVADAMAGPMTPDLDPGDPVTFTTAEIDIETEVP